MITAMKQIPLPFLGGLTAAQFFDEYWQKKPLLIRQAFPGFTGLLTPNELAGLACEEDAQSRLVMHKRGKWLLESGPFAEERFSDLPKKDWTLLVQGVNHFLPEAAELLQQFNVVPTARLDDLMVSFAPDGGGVGPHFDSYDVFLLQGMGQRLWRVSDQDDMQLIEGAPLRILQRFDTQQEWLLDPGDMLYLPPRYAHWGIAVGECMTYSVGFRAPTAQELGTQFLSFLQDKLALAGMYADPDLQPQQHPAEIGEQMVDKVSEMLQAITWGREDVAQFLGTYLSEPKPHVVFTPRRLTIDKFAQRVAKQGVQLALATQMLFYQDAVFINGERHAIEPSVSSVIRGLADSRRLAAQPAVPEAMLKLLHSWYLAGFLELGS
jgi:50S ribosomal protein L16 3-hydroxylase